jgi:hypothetical protein
LLALTSTIFFSLSSLSKTDQQNKNATEQLMQAKAQLMLAQQQFQYSKKLHTEDSLLSIGKEKLSNDRFVKDTARQRQRELAQQSRNQLQDIANKQQFNLNKSQLKAVQIQAKTAEAQYYQQQKQYQQQLYEQRPIFTIDSVQISNKNSVLSKLRFFISNVGYRPAHIDSTLLAFFNSDLLCFSVTSNVSNLDLIPGKNVIFTSEINIYQNCLLSNTTFYYLIVYYKDTYTGKNQIEPIFFTYQIIKPNKFGWSRIYGPAIEEFKNKLKQKKVLVVE